MKFKTIDKREFTATSNEDLVRQLRDSSFDARDLPLDAFMRRMAATAAAWDKRPVRSSSVEVFVADLIDAGIVWRIAD